MKRRYTIMEDNIGETQVKLEQALLVANEVPSLVIHKNDSTIHVTPSNKTAWNGAVTDIGTKANLLTADKSNLVGAVNELFTNANNGKTAVASAVTAKGVPASPTDTFAVLASKIGQISTGKRAANGVVNSGANNRITINNLDFTPSLIMCSYTPSPGNAWHYVAVGFNITKLPFIPTYNSSGSVANLGLLIMSDASSSPQIGTYSPGSNYVSFNETGFSVVLPNANSNYNWIAYE